MEEQLSRAEEIYINNLGSAFYMARNGVLEEYRSCQVSGEQEAAWRQELVAQISLSLELDSLKRLSSLSAIFPYHGDSLILEAVILYIMNNLDKMDSYVRLLFANQLWAMAGVASRELPGGVYSQARNMALMIWQNIMTHPVVISPDTVWEAEGDNLSREEYIRQEAQKGLDQA